MLTELLAFIRAYPWGCLIAFGMFCTMIERCFRAFALRNHPNERNHEEDE